MSRYYVTEVGIGTASIDVLDGDTGECVASFPIDESRADDAASVLRAQRNARERADRLNKEEEARHG